MDNRIFNTRVVSSRVGEERGGNHVFIADLRKRGQNSSDGFPRYQLLHVCHWHFKKDSVGYPELRVSSLLFVSPVCLIYNSRYVTITMKLIKQKKKKKEARNVKL